MKTKKLLARPVVFALPMVLASITVLESSIFVRPSIADSPSQGFCGALVQGRDAWYHNCTATTVRKRSNLWVAWGKCETIPPGGLAHWHDLFNIRGVIDC